MAKTTSSCHTLVTEPSCARLQLGQPLSRIVSHPVTSRGYGLIRDCPSPFITSVRGLGRVRGHVIQVLPQLMGLGNLHWQAFRYHSCSLPLSNRATWLLGR